MSLLRRPDHFLLRRFRPSICDIITNRAGFQPCFLENHAVTRSQALSRDLPHIGSVHPDGAGVHVVEPHEQVNHSTLSAAGRPYDGNPLSGLHFQIHILDQGHFRIIGEIHIVQRHFPLYLRQNGGIRRVRNLRLLVNQFKDTGRRGQRVLKLRHHTGYLVKRLRILVCIA